MVRVSLHRDFLGRESTQTMTCYLLSIVSHFIFSCSPGQAKISSTLQRYQAIFQQLSPHVVCQADAHPKPALSCGLHCPQTEIWCGYDNRENTGGM